MNKEQFLALIQKYLSGQASLEEEQLLLNYYGSFQDSDVWDEDTMGVKDEVEARILNKLEIHVKRKNTVNPTIRLWPRIAAVAAAVAAVVFGVWFFTYKEIASVPRNDVSYANDIAPGTNGATITLANGKVILLSGAKKGAVITASTLTYDDGTVIDPSLRNIDPSLRGTKQSQDKLTSIPRNDEQLTAATAKGQTYQFTLPDGTHVWLNADSKISFPSQFNGKERKILLSGEAYFAVVHNAKQPFRVETIAGANKPGQIVEDIGTEFNINAYADESSIKTTLVEGSARISLSIPSLRGAAGNEAILKPNQQSTNTGGVLVVNNVDASEAIAWQKGYFLFVEEDIQSVMRKVARWYNVEVVYSAGIENAQIGGSVSRFSNVSKVLSMMQETGAVNFKIEGRTVYVSK